MSQFFSNQSQQLGFTTLEHQRTVRMICLNRQVSPSSHVLLCFDGQSVEALAKGALSLFNQTSFADQSIVLIGIPSHPEHRAHEYIAGLDDKRHQQHRRFVVEEVIPWTEARLGHPLSRTNTAILGISNGAVAAMQLGLDHRNLFGSIFSFSLVGGHERYSDAALTLGPIPRIYLLAGSREIPMRKTSERLSARLCKLGVPHRLHIQPNATHNMHLWQNHMAEVSQWWVAQTTDSPSVDS